MNNVAKNCTSNLIPCLQYRNALKMINWLEQAFGFEKHAVYMGGENIVAHAQMKFGNGMIMLGSVKNNALGELSSAKPAENLFRETQSSYLIVTACEPIYLTAKAAAAKIILDLREMEYGGQGFSCADPEGHLWSIGTYDPWEPA